MKAYFFDLPLESIHKNAFGAAVAANCAAEQGKFWEMHGLLFQNQKALGKENLEAYGEQLELNMQEFTVCLEDEKPAEAIRRDMAVASQAGVRGTPNFWLGKVDSKDPNKATMVQNLRGAASFNQFKALLDPLLEEAESQ